MAFLHQDDLKNRMNSSFFLIISWCNQSFFFILSWCNQSFFFISSWCTTASAARNWINMLYLAVHVSPAKSVLCNDWSGPALSKHSSQKCRVKHILPVKQIQKLHIFFIFLRKNKQKFLPASTPSPFFPADISTHFFFHIPENYTPSHSQYHTFHPTSS